MYNITKEFADLSTLNIMQSDIKVKTICITDAEASYVQIYLWNYVMWSYELLNTFLVRI